MVDSFRDLEVWRRGVRFVRDVYRATDTFPPHERFGLTAQIRRAAVSIASNVAEGRARFSTREFARHVSIARGSVAEVETQVEIAIELGYLQRSAVENLMQECDELSRMLRTMYQNLSRNSRIAESAG